eukprot:CAMPEP_0171698512 /NCGR_PEP_ID=MMETSP0991-20121206/9398_1 /TAXON_ID=483369 /ORGANISM="non described non described, Strain CCMP2098" /LENGTH=212 /DNA_ID=CAMNT_0012287385 /DNA_START=12 /DNA_END=650 /DNA_ORIENTATION=+
MTSNETRGEITFLVRPAPPICCAPPTFLFVCISSLQQGVLLPRLCYRRPGVKEFGVRGVGRKQVAADALHAHFPATTARPCFRPCRGFVSRRRTSHLQGRNAVAVALVGSEALLAVLFWGPASSFCSSSLGGGLGGVGEGEELAGSVGGVLRVVRVAAQVNARALFEHVVFAQDGDCPQERGLANADAVALDVRRGVVQVKRSTALQRHHLV